jgi:geranylgeranyl pyrophosphate synthase
MITCHLGQAEDVYTHKITRAEDLPTLEEYIRMTSAKTSSLFTMLIEMLSVVLKIDQKNTEALINTMRYVGISFQITDDILNITDNLGKQQKA